MKTRRLLVLFLILLFFTAAAGFGLELTVIGPPKTLLKVWDGDELMLDPNGRCIIPDLAPGDKIIFTAEASGRFPEDYSVEMGELSKTFRIDPRPRGVISGELKFTDAGFCPAAGCELYFIPQSAYASIDLYQSFFSVAEMFTGQQELSTRYVMPMLGAGVYILPYESFVRLNLGASVGCMFGNELPHPLFAAEIAAGIEFRFFENYILFAEFNPRVMSAIRDGDQGWTGWNDYRDIFGSSRADYMFNLGSWGMSGLPSTMFGFKYKY